MAQHMKRWESPRREGRNDKGRGGSARQRQRQKQLKRLAQRLKQASVETEQPQKRQKHRPDKQHNQKREESQALFPFDLWVPNYLLANTSRLAFRVARHSECQKVHCSGASRRNNGPFGVDLYLTQEVLICLRSMIGAQHEQGGRCDALD